MSMIFFSRKEGFVYMKISRGNGIGGFHWLENERKDVGVPCGNFVSVNNFFKK